MAMATRHDTTCTKPMRRRPAIIPVALAVAALVPSTSAVRVSAFSFVSQSTTKGRDAHHPTSILPRKQHRQALPVHTRHCQWKAQTELLAKNTRNNNKKNNEDNNDDNPFFSLLDNVARIATTPTPFFPDDDNMSLPLVYPATILILAVTGILSPLATLVLAILFGIFRFLGGGVLLVEEQEEEESPRINLLAFGAAFLSTLLVTPNTAPPPTMTFSTTALSNNAGEFPLFILASAVGFGILAKAFLQNNNQTDDNNDVPSPEQQRMELWDDEFQKGQQQSNDTRK